MKKNRVEFEEPGQKVDGETWRRRIRYDARRAIAGSLWTYTRTTEFRTVSDAFKQLSVEVLASVLINAHRFASDPKFKLNETWLPSIPAAKQIAEADGRDVVTPNEDEIALASNFETRPLQLKLIASACVKYASVSLNFYVNKKDDSIYSELAALAGVYALLGSASGIDLALSERARKGQRGRERTLELRRKLASESICRCLDKFPHLTGPKVADEVISDVINLSHREITKLANQEIRLRR